HPLVSVGAPGGVINIPGTRELMKDLDAKHAAWINNRREEDERAKREAQLAAERDAARFAPLKPAPQRAPVQTGPPRPIQGTFPLVRRPEPEHIAPEPLEAV